jgi:hypothetical protein
MLNIFGLFGKLGQYATWVIIAVLLFFGFRWLWLRPEILNPTARAYKTHVEALQSDSTNKHLEILNLGGVIVMKDSTIAKMGREYKKLEGEIQKALAYGSEWKDRFSNQVARSDHKADTMTDQQREEAVQDAYQKNGTLPKSPVLLPFNSPIVVKAALKTANREEIGRKVIDTLSTSVGHYKAATERLGEGLSAGISGLKVISKEAADNQRGGIPIIRSRRRKQNKKIQVKADSLIKKMEAVTDLEKDLNKIYEK